MDTPASPARSVRLGPLEALAALVKRPISGRGAGRGARRVRLQARRTLRLTLLVVAAVAAGVAAVGFARLCDVTQGWHDRLLHASRLGAVLAPVVALPLATWVTRRFAPAAAGSGIPQVIAAGEDGSGPGDPRLSLRTAAVKVVVSAGLIAAGASIGREGPTVQVAAALVAMVALRLRGGPSRRALLTAGGAAGVAAAFNTPIAGVVFGVEELARGFDRRTNAVVILVVVAAGAAAYSLAGNYAYFGDLGGEVSLRSAWFAAPVIGAICGLAGGAFSQALIGLIGARPNRLGRWRMRRPLAFALGCGVVASLAALASHGLSYGTGYAEARSLFEGHAGRGGSLAVFKWIANLAAAASGAPGGIFSPSLATGAGVGAALQHAAAALHLPFTSPRDAVVLGMAAYLSGVVQAPLTSAVILMEMTRDPGLVGPLMLATLLARRVSETVCPEPVYHALAQSWRRPTEAAKA